MGTFDPPFCSKGSKESPDESELWPNQHFSAEPRSVTRQEHTALLQQISLSVDHTWDLGDSTAVHLAPCAATIPKPAGRPIVFH